MCCSPRAAQGGNDVFVDCGNKSLGLQAMMAFTGAIPREVRGGAVK